MADRRWVGASLALLLLSACGAADARRADGSASLEAVLSIERLEEAGHSDTPSASAMAQFVILPSDADVHDTLGAAGLRAQLPEHAGCVDLAASEAAASARRAPNGLRYSLREPLELLEAGDVSIRAGDMLTRLALNSFPPSGSASGVIYTTPDLSAEPLPPDENYAIRATGSSSIPPISIGGRAPLALADVTVGGQPLERPGVVAPDAALDAGGAPVPPQLPAAAPPQPIQAAPLSVTAGQPLDITWGVGSAGDRIYVEIADAEHSLACAFPDEDGAGTVPGTLTAQLRSEPGSSVRLSVHRVREAVQPDTALEEAHPDNPSYGLSLETTVRFDFETTAVVRVQ
jgi:hypothetical protein